MRSHVNEDSTKVTMYTRNGQDFHGNRFIGSPGVSVATDTRDQKTNCSLWWLLFGAPEVIKGRTRENACGPRVEAGSNTSTVTLRVVGGYEKGSLKS
jgi:hypothetical protein